jgi:hypothetical protein
MRALNRGAFLALLALLAFDGVVHGQADDGQIATILVPLDGDELGTLPVSYRIYGEPNVLRLGLSLVNQSDATIVIDQEAIRSTLRVRLSAGQEVAANLRWLPDLHLPGDLVPTMNSWGPISLESKKGLTWLIEVEREDLEPFGRGRLTVQFEIPDIIHAIHKPDETAWIGRVPTRPGVVSLVIAPPNGPAETSARYRFEARQAMFRKEYIKSIEAYSRAVAANPSDRQAESGLAGALLAAGRYREAVTIYEKRWPSMSPASAEYPLVVMAYLGIGDEQTARSLLQRMGVTSERVNDKVAEYRDANRRRDRPR